MARRAPERQAARRRAGLALAVSLGLHAGLVVLAVRADGFRPPPPVQSVPIQLDLREAEPPPAPQAARAPTPPRARPPDPLPTPPPRTPPDDVSEPAAPDQKAPEAQAQADRDAAAPPEAGAPPAPGPASPGDGSAAGDGAPGEGPLAGSGSNAGRAGLLVPPDLLSERALVGSLERSRRERESGAGLGEVDGSFDDLAREPEGDDPGAERTRVSRRIGHDAARAQAEGRVRAGLVDPYFHQLGRQMRGAFTPTPDQFDAPGEGGTGLVAGARRVVRDYFSAGKQYAQTGSPYETPPPREPHVPRPLERSEFGDSGFDPADFAARWNRGEFAFLSGLVVVQLTQDEQGRPLEARIVASSGRPGLDRSATEAVLAAARERAAPQSGLGLGGGRIKSLWRLQAKLVRCSPTPSGTFEETALPLLGDKGGTIGEGGEKRLAELCPPFEQRIRTTVELVAVFGGAATPGAAAAPAPR